MASQSLRVSCSNNKRSRNDLPSSSSSPQKSNFSLNDLQELLIEVLLRLPSFKYAFQCKCVSKNWYSLISTPFFARRFISHHFNHQGKQNPSALIISYVTKDFLLGLSTVSDEPMFKSSGFELNYLPAESGRVAVLAICNDLMLCMLDSRNETSYCICNPFTSQWVTLPLLEHDKGSRGNDIGFVCEPYYFEDSQGESTLNSNYRFRVVDVDRMETGLILCTYCSETQKWSKSVLQGSEYNLWCTNIVAYDGKLLWYNGRSIFAYDPFNPELSTFIDCSNIHSTASVDDSYYYTIGVCQGFVRMMQVVEWGTSKSLAIWELNDYGTGGWSLVDKFNLDMMIPESLIVNVCQHTSLAHEIEGGRLSLNLLGFHRTDKDIVYLSFQALVISYNMCTRELKMVCDVPCASCFIRIVGRAFNIELPLWPTPIHKLIEIRR